MKVEKSKLYEKFNTLKGNRNINLLNKQRLLKSFEEKHLISPITVNEKYEIIDGQHRFEAAKELGLPIYYIVLEGYGLEEVQTLNANQKNWVLMDYVDGFINLGKRDYSAFKEIKTEYNLPTIQTIEILEGRKDKSAGRSIVQDFKNGLFKVKDLRKAIFVFDSIVRCSSYYDGYKRKSFVVAMTILLKNPKFKIDVFIKKLKTSNKKLMDCVNATEYVLLIEEIYNYKNRNKVGLRY